jgi:hypothetical protein
MKPPAYPIRGLQPRHQAARGYTTSGHCGIGTTRMTYFPVHMLLRIDTELTPRAPHERAARATITARRRAWRQGKK